MVHDESLAKAIRLAKNDDRGWGSQIILNELRNFVENVIFLSAFRNKEADKEYNYENIRQAQTIVRGQGKLRFLWKFHEFLQISASHYTLDENASERLMLKYYDWLIDIRSYLDNEFGIQILQCLDDFPLNRDSTTLEYQAKIASCIGGIDFSRSAEKLSQERYYIQKAVPFFVGGNKYYEITFTSVNEESSKFNRHIAFSKSSIPDFYAVKLTFSVCHISLFDRHLPISIITGWKTSIRPCELNNFASLFQIYPRISIGAGYHLLMEKLTDLQLPFNDIIFLPIYKSIKDDLYKYSNITNFFRAIDKTKSLIESQKPGANVLSYLLYNLRNKNIKKQRQYESNRNLSGLNLKNGCIPFDTMPFCTSLLEHNPAIYDLLSCINPASREHEFLARFVRNNAEINGVIYTKIHELPVLLQNDLENKITKYNSLLWSGHSERKLKIKNDFIFLAEYENDVSEIIQRLHSLSQTGMTGYEIWVKTWFRENPNMIDCPEKKKFIGDMFENSCVAFVYGAAGTGKTTLIKHISALFSENKKIFLAQTNPAVDNLRRKIQVQNSSFYTITKALSSSAPVLCDLLFIDECSTVSNKDMKDVLKKVSFKLLILVGDIYQIESINFGNWFTLGKNFVKKFICELTQPYRSNKPSLLTLWERVRLMKDDISEHLQKNGFSSDLDESIFCRSHDDEVILCLNYDGVYGINNLNRFLQQRNMNPSIHWHDNEYKIGDPVLFNETSRFGNVIYNNMKGHIRRIELINGNTQIQFDIELDRALNILSSSMKGFSIIGSLNDHSVVRFVVEQATDSDEDNDNTRNVIPFQVAYAVSIHKAQGLEYQSVKIVIASEVGEQITHNIFYTAITRAREVLKIYWSPECEKKVLSTMKIKDCQRDFNILKQHENLKNLR